MLLVTVVCVTSFFSVRSVVSGWVRLSQEGFYIIQVSYGLLLLCRDVSIPNVDPRFLMKESELRIRIESMEKS